MAGETNNLGSKQQKALACLLSEPTIAEAASKAGVGERTLHRWLDESAFAEAYRAARREAVHHAMTTLQRVSASAALVLQSIMEDATKPASSRLAAARAVLEFAFRAVELEDLEQRVAQLEERYGTKH